MSNSLEFKISADDQASRVVETVQNKIQNFGHDVAKMALGIAGPMALVQLAFQKISEYYSEQERKRQDAMASVNSDPIYEQLKASGKYTDELDRQNKLLAIARNLEEERLLKTSQNKKVREQNVLNYLEYKPDQIITPERQKVMDVIAQEGLLFNSVGYAAENIKVQQAVIDAQLTGKLKEIEDELKLQEQLTNKKLTDAKHDKYALEEFDRIQKRKLTNLSEELKLKQDIAAAAQKELDLAKKPLTVSGIREIGGGLAGETANIQNRSMKQVDQISILEQTLSAAQDQVNKTNQNVEILKDIRGYIENAISNGIPVNLNDYTPTKINTTA